MARTAKRILADAYDNLNKDISADEVVVVEEAGARPVLDSRFTRLYMFEGMHIRWPKMSAGATIVDLNHPFGSERFMFF